MNEASTVFEENIVVGFMENKVVQDYRKLSIIAGNG